MNLEKKLPEIRFEGFCGAWNNLALGENARFTKGQGYSKSDLVSCGSPIILYGRLYTRYQTVINCVDTFVNEKTKPLKSIGGEVLVPASGESPEDISRASVVNEPNVILGGDLNVIYPNKKIDPVFLALAISNGHLKKELSSKAQGKSVVHIRNSDLADLNITLPCDKEEQTAIGNTFREFDSLISQLKQKHEKLNNIKKAMLEKMFPKQGETVPEIRFKGFSGEWEEKELGSVAQVTMGQSPSGQNYTNNPNDFILVQGNADLKNGFVVPRVWTSEVTKKAVKGALVFSVRAPVGEVGKTNYDVVLGRGVAAVYGNEFIYQQLKKLKSDNYWYKVSAGSTFDAISSTELASTLIWISSEPEQKKIGSYFQKLDTLINQHQQQIIKLNNIKQACLSKMFV